MALLADVIRALDQDTVNPWKDNTFLEFTPSLDPHHQTDITMNTPFAQRHIAPAVLATLILGLSASQAQAQVTPPIKEVGVRSGFTQYHDLDANGTAAVTSDIGYFQGSAFADLSTGTLKALASTSTTQGNGCTPGEVGCFWGSQSRAFFIDTITLHRTGPAGQPTTINWHFDIDGSRSNGPFSDGNTTAMAYGYVGDNTEVMGAVNGVDLGNSNRISGSVTFDASDYTVYVYGALDLIARNGATADYSHTMKFQWDLPQDITYTSQSGAFLKATAAVPEPGSALLSLVGLGVIGVSLNQRRRAAA